MAAITRKVYLKKILFRARDKEFTPPKLHELLAKNITPNSLIRDRHYPDPAHINNETKRCLFINRFKNTKRGFRFEICSYVPGHTPTQMLPNMDATETEILDDPIVDKTTSQTKEIVVVASCLILGEAIVLEMPQNLGGFWAIEQYLSFFLRKYLDHKHPKVHLFDVAPGSFKQVLKIGGGATEMILKVAHEVSGEEKSIFAYALSKLRRKVGGTECLTAKFKGKGPAGTLSSDDVIDLYEQYKKNDELDGFIIVTKNGERIVGTERLKIQRDVRVQSTKSRNPVRTEIEHELHSFLGDLMLPEDDNPCVLTTDGMFVNH